MTRADASGSGQSGGPPPREPAETSSPAVFADLGPPLGPLESVERLRILEALSYGVLYEGRLFQTSRAQDIWLLELDSVFEQDSKTFASVLIEISAASKLSDPSIVAPRGVFRHGENLYLLFDSYAGVSLATAFEFLGRSGLHLSAEAVLRVAGGVLSALDAAARLGPGEEDESTCHGLVTPENIFLAEGQRVLMRGFGFWRAGVHNLGLLGPGERRYLAPGQNRKGTASPRNDLLALGTILFEAVVGYPAFDSPPEEEDLAELRGSVGELQSKAEPSLWDLFEVILACLTPPSTMTPAYRARVRKTVDTLFLREFSRDRDPRTLSLEDLLSRVKPRRPAIVKATSISLMPAEAAVPLPEVQPQQAEAGEGRESRLEDASSIAAPAAPEAPAKAAIPPPRAVISPGFPAIRQRREHISVKTWVFATAAAIAVALLISVALSSWPRLEHLTPARSPSPQPDRLSVLAPTPSPVEKPVPTESIPTPPATTSPAPADTPAAPTPAPKSRRTPQIPSRPPRLASIKQPLRRREMPQRFKSNLSEPAPATATGNSSVAADRGPVPVVVPGTLISWSTPGLVPPALINDPPVPRYEQSDPRPALLRSALLEILVSDSGRVRGSRIVRADRMPPGFAGGIERYLAAMRFRPAEVGGVQVKVWMPYELKYYAP